MTAFGDRLIRAAQEAREIARGEAVPSTYRVHVPTEIDVASIRKRLRMTQASFADVFGFPAGTIRDWEQGRRQPDTAARAYLRVIAHDPTAVRRALNQADGGGQPT